LEQRSYFSELVLVVIVLVFVVSCVAILNAVHRTLPQPATLAAAETPNATATPVATPTAALIASAATSAPAPTPAKAAPTATAGPNLAAYLPVTGAELGKTPDQYSGKKVVVSGTVYYINPQGDNTWVQVLTQDNVFVDVNFTGQAAVQKNQTVKVYGTANGLTTIRAADGRDYSQPFINPGDMIQKA
jgi:hypothetical protein